MKKFGKKFNSLNITMDARVNISLSLSVKNKTRSWIYVRSSHQSRDIFYHSIAQKIQFLFDKAFITHYSRLMNFIVALTQKTPHSSIWFDEIPLGCWRFDDRKCNNIKLEKKVLFILPIHISSLFYIHHSPISLHLNRLTWLKCCGEVEFINCGRYPQLPIHLILLMP